MSIGSVSAVATQDAQSALTLAALFSTSAGGQAYPAQVELSGGSYVATVPSLPGVSATGGTVLEAETNLNLRISILV
jgi:hypothetical protein